MTENTHPMEKQKLSSRMKKRALFYVCMVTPLLLHIAIFYWYINVETFVLAFQYYEMPTPGQPLKATFAGLHNFKLAFNWMFTDPTYVLNAVKFFAIKLIISYTLCLLFSYYIYKKLPMASIFKYFLFVPHILSSLLLVVLFQFVVGDFYKAMQVQWFGVEKEMATGLLDASRSASSRFAVVIFYGIWHGFGTSVLIYASTMESIDYSMVESAQLDGVNVVQEFMLITMPMIWSTFVTFLITSISGVFMDHFHLFTFYANSAPNDMQVIGYKMYTSTLNAYLYEKPADINVRNELSYPGLSAAGLMITLFMTPIVLFIRKVLIKWGPSVN